VESLRSAGLAIAPVQKRGAGRALESLERSLRALDRPVIGRIAEQQLLLDCRCLEDETELGSQLPALARLLS
jgi:L-seryl-tRNA(Ser) seleniumtransferase